MVSSTINAGLVLAALVPGVLRPLPAQVLRGRIVEAETARPVPGALVLLVGESDSASLGRTMTSDVGRFELPAPREGTYRLRVLRIGHQAWMSAAMEVLSVGREVQLAVPALPFTLEEISVTEKPQCALEVASSSGAGALLEEAWKAFTLTEQTLGRSELVFEVLLSYRATDQRGNLTSERGARRVGRGSWPVISINPESLEVAGFVQPRDTIQGPIYFGPDPRVLFSEPFLRTHCFRGHQVRAGLHRAGGSRVSAHQASQAAGYRGGHVAGAEELRASPTRVPLHEALGLGAQGLGGRGDRVRATGEGRLGREPMVASGAGR